MSLSPAHHLRALIDLMLPPEVASEGGPERTRGRALVVTSLGGLAVGAVSAIAASQHGAVLNLASGLLAIAGFALVPVVYRMTAHHKLAAWCFLGWGAVLATLFIPMTGGLSSVEIYWLPLFPAVALVVLDYRAAVVTTSFVCGLVLAMIAAHRFGVIPQPTVRIGPADSARIIIVSVGFYLVASWVREHALEEVRAREDDQARTRARLEAADRTRGSILASVSHELRTPMTGILGLSELLSDSDLDPKQRDWVRTIRQTGTALLTLLDDLLDSARLDSGNLTLKERPFRPADLAEQVIALFRPRARSRRLGLHLDVTAGVPTKMRGDPARIRQVLINLVGNALKFTSEGGVVVRVSQTPGALVYEVTDSGVGIPQERLADVFEPFVRANEEASAAAGGVGLGLSIARVLVEAMRGEITARSEVGVGTTFEVSLPLEIVDDDAPTTDTPLLPPRKGSALRVLVAEDNEVNRMVLVAMLESLGNEVHVVHNGDEVVPAVRSFHPDVVLMDMRMPVVDGLEATRRLRADPAFDTLRILALTANAFEEDRQACYAVGMDGFLAKPVSRAQLKVALEFGGIAAEIGFRQRA